MIKQHLPDIKPFIFQSDFEIGALNAFVSVCPTADIKWCFFHFGQALRRKVKTDIGNGQHALLLFTAFAYLPASHIPEVYLIMQLELEGNILLWDDFLNYFVSFRVDETRNFGGYKLLQLSPSHYKRMQKMA